MNCKDCGCKMYDGFCTNCHEEIFIQDQYIELNEDVPESIVKKCNEYINNKR